MQLAFASRTRLELFAAGARHCYFAIFRMNSGFHFFSPRQLSISCLDQTSHDTSRNSLRSSAWHSSKLATGGDVVSKSKCPVLIASEVSGLVFLIKLVIE